MKCEFKVSGYECGLNCLRPLFSGGFFVFLAANAEDLYEAGSYRRYDVVFFT